MRWLQWLALLSIIAASLVISASVWRAGGSTTGTVSSGAEWSPSMTPDDRIDYLLAVLTPTATMTVRPTWTPRPSPTPLSYCYGTPEPKKGTRCDPRPPTPVTAPTQIVPAMPLTCATVAAGIASGERLAWPQSCTWDG